MIECLKYKPINKGSLLGYADIFVPKMGLEIFGCSLHQKDGRRWVNFPSKNIPMTMVKKNSFRFYAFETRIIWKLLRS